MRDWHQFGIGELQSAFSREEMTPTQYVTEMLARIEAHNPKLNAFIEVNRDIALAAAAESDERFREDEQRPLEGVVIGVKANIAVQGFELNAGMEARRGIVADQDAEAVIRLKNAGAIVVGTNNMHEGALGASSDNPWFGTAYNPHGEGLSPGGSSGGSAAAVAAGLCVASLGTDTLGSVRIPSAYCGVFGMKSTRGAIPSMGVVPLSHQFDSIGPIARSLEDISILSHILFSPDLSTAMRRTQFMILANSGDVECTAPVAAAYETVVSELPNCVPFIDLPESYGRIRTAGFVLAARELINSLVELGPERCEKLSPEIESHIDFAISRSDADLADDERIVLETRETLVREIGSNGVLVLPTTPQTAFAQGSRGPNNQADFTALANIAGLPALSIPIGRDSNQHPIGVQLIGPIGGEPMLIAQARMINDKIRGYFPPPQFW